MKKNISHVFLLFFIIQIGCAQENPPIIQIPEVMNYSYEIVIDGIDIPWGMAFINQDELLVTEQAGTLYYVKNGEKKIKHKKEALMFVEILLNVIFAHTFRGVA